MYDVPVNVTTGATYKYLPLTSFTAINALNSSATENNGAKVRFVEGFIRSRQVIETSLGDGADGVVSTVDQSSSTADHFAIASLYDPGAGDLDNTALIYSDNNQVNLDLFNEQGQQIGADNVIPGLASFDQIHTLAGDGNSSAHRVEIDDTVIDPSSGAKVEGLIYDTQWTADDYTIGGAGSNENKGAPFDDVLTYAPGVDALDGAGGYNTFNDAGVAANAVTTTLNAQGELIVNDGLGDTDTLIDVQQINFSNSTLTLSGDTLQSNTADLAVTGAIAATITGPGDAVALSNSANAILNGGGQANISGGGDTVWLDGSNRDFASISGAGSTADAISGSNAVIGVTSSQTSLTGTSDTV